MEWGLCVLGGLNVGPGFCTEVNSQVGIWGIKVGSSTGKLAQSYALTFTRFQVGH